MGAGALGAGESSYTRRRYSLVYVAYVKSVTAVEHRVIDYT